MDLSVHSSGFQFIFVHLSVLQWMFVHSIDSTIFQRVSLYFRWVSLDFSACLCFPEFEGILMH